MNDERVIRDRHGLRANFYAEGKTVREAREYGYETGKKDGFRAGIEYGIIIGFLLASAAWFIAGVVR